MAGEFAPKIQDTGVQIRGAQNPTALSDLFKGLGDTAMDAVNVTDQVIQGNIQEGAEDLFNETMKPYEDLAGMPTEISQSQDRMARIQTAFEQGKISDTRFYGELVSGTKKLKAKYPGYTKQIDSIIQSVTGIRPANALRNSILSEIQSSQNAAEQAASDWEKFIIRKDVAESVSNSFPDLYTNPEKYNDPAIQAQVKTQFAQYQYQKGQLDIVSKELSIDKATYDKNERRIKSVVNNSVSFTVNEAIAGLDRAAINSYGVNVNKLMSDISSGKMKMDAAALDDFRTQVAIRRNEVAQNVRRDVAQSTNGFMSPEDIDKSLQDALRPFDDIISLMGSGEYDLAGRAARETKIRQDRDLNGLIKGSDQLRFIKNLNAISPELYRKYLEENYGTDLMNTIQNINLSNMNYDGQSIGEAIDNTLLLTNLTEGERTRSVRSTIEGASVQLKDPNANPAQLKKMVDSVYGDPEIYDKFGQKSQLDVYKRFVSPEVTSNIVKMNDQEALDKYYKFAVDSTYRISYVKESLMNVNDIQQTKDFLSATLDEKGNVVLEADQEAFETWADGANAATVKQMEGKIRDTINSVNQANTVFSSLSEVAKAKGNDPKEEIATIMKNLSIDLDMRKGTGLISKLIESITDVSKEPSADKDLKERTKTKLQNLLNSDVFNQEVSVNKNMNPSFGGKGLSALVKPKATASMDSLLKNEYQTMSKIFKSKTGKDVMINDAIAKKGTTRVKNTPNSRHFHGDALDLSTRDMTDAEKMELVKAAKEAGFTGFGYGENILHVDKGKSRKWMYKNKTFAGLSLDKL